MEIIKGKFYRTRGGKKVEVLKVDCKNDRPVLILYCDDEEEIGFLYQNGMYDNNKIKTNADIISEWTDPVEIPWSDYPSWCKWVAMDGWSNGWACFNIKPEIDGPFWYGGMKIFIPEDYHPRNFTGDWTESLFERPCE